jgi:hypothetical protein
VKLSHLRFHGYAIFDPFFFLVKFPCMHVLVCSILLSTFGFKYMPPLTLLSKVQRVPLDLSYLSVVQIFIEKTNSQMK